MKRKFSVILILCVIISSVLTAQQYQIRNVSYIIDGMTWEYSLRKNIKIETDTIFDDKNSLEKYITDLKQQFQNLRILESSTITWTEAPIREDGIIPIDMVISVKDTINMLGVPYPKYNSNDGLQLKLKYKDYSFIGTMEELNADILYEYNEDSEHILGGGIAFSIPYVITSVRSTLSSLTPQYEEASYDLGAGKFKTFWYVTLPLIMPGVVSGATLAFTLSLDDVVISYFTAGPSSNTLPLKIYSMIKTGITPDVNALTSLMLLATIIILSVSTIMQSRSIAKKGRLV